MTLTDLRYSDRELATYPNPEAGWTCFHCGETFLQAEAAREHFGEHLADEPGCVEALTLGQRGLLRELRKSRSRERRLDDRVDVLAQQLYVQKTDLERHFGGATSLHEAAHNYESVERRALAAEAILADVARRWPALAAASRRQVTDGPRPGAPRPIADLLDAARPLAEFVDDRVPDDLPVTAGSELARTQLVAGQFKALGLALREAAALFARGY